MYYNNRKLALSIFWLILGITVIVLSVTKVLDSSLFAGMGEALTVVGILQIVKNLKYKNDAAYREKIDTEAKDERNRFLRMKSWSWAGYTAILLEGIGVVIATILGQQTVLQVLSYSVCLIMCSYWASYLILSKKY
ncbi:MAG: hypothetical protein K5746_05830 [Clostridiales bacterium]|nr:hypothetical protein [Clostridiales bacterium]